MKVGQIIFSVCVDFFYELLLWMLPESMLFKLKYCVKFILMNCMCSLIKSIFLDHVLEIKMFSTFLIFEKQVCS